MGFHQAQAETWKAQQRFVFFIAGTQSGKTSFGPWWLVREMERRGPGDYLAVTATYDLFKLKMLPEMQLVLCELLDLGAVYMASDRMFLLRGGYRVILRSADSPGGLESATAQAAWLDECGQDRFDLDAWEAVQRRLSLSQGRVLGTTTPYNLGWLRSEVVDRYAAGDRDYRVVRAASIVNPAFPRAEYERAKRVMPDWKFKMFWMGEFSEPAGLVYGDLTEDLVCEPFDLPGEWPRFVGVDFGGANTATVWAAEDVANGVAYVYRETLEGSLSTPDHAAVFWRRAAGETVAAVAGGAPGETQQRADWQAAGVPVRQPLVGDVEAGIDRVVLLLRSKRLRFFRSCRGLLDEAARYRRKVGESGEVLELIENKAGYHRLDALRYLAGLLVHAAPAGAVVAQPAEYMDGRY